MAHPAVRSVTQPSSPRTVSGVRSSGLSRQTLHSCSCVWYAVGCVGAAGQTIAQHDKMVDGCAAEKTIMDLTLGPTERGSSYRHRHMAPGRHCHGQLERESRCPAVPDTVCWLDVSAAPAPHQV